jgi:hypothetical protein
MVEAHTREKILVVHRLRVQRARMPNNKKRRKRVLRQQNSNSTLA